MRLVSIVDAGLGACQRVIQHLASALLAIMLVMNLINVIVRAIFAHELTFVAPWTMVLFVWLCFLGFFVITRINRDVSVDFVVEKIGGRTLKLARVATEIILVAMTVVIMLQLPKTVSLQSSLIPMVGIERYYLSLPLFLSCALILLNALVTLAKMAIGEQEGTHVQSGTGA